VDFPAPLLPNIAILSDNKSAENRNFLSSSLTYGLEKKFVDRYNPEELEKAYRLTVPQIVEDTLNALK
jgi:deoxyxylulose-5-phosphate synthase